jgi:hypothetical protein
MRSIFLICSTVALSIPSPALSHSAPPPGRGIDQPYPNCWNGICFAPTPLTVSADIEHRKRLLALHDEGVRQRQLDGGVLTDAHRAELQTKLDQIQGRYREILRRADWSDSRKSNRRAETLAGVTSTGH